MPRKYDISKKSDMKKFMKDLEKNVVDKTMKQTIKAVCPHCKNLISVTLKSTHCPKCCEEIHFDIK